MKIKIQYIVICLFLLLQMLPSNAYSGEKAGEVSISPMVGVYVFDNEQNIKKDAIAALGLAYNFTENWAGELMLDYGRFDHKYFDFNACRCDEERIDGFVMHLDALYNFWPDQTLVPYLAAGIGGVMLDGDHLDEDYPIVNGGGGIKYFLTENVALRADARYLFDLEDSNNNAAFTVGMTFQFGGEEQVIPAPPAAPAPEPMVVPIEKFKSAPIQEKVTIDLKVQFDFDKSYVKPEYHDNIKKLADFMKEYPEIIADIQGHTCNMGSSAYNIGLSQRRAESVKNYMVKNFGIEASRLITHGYGFTMPIADNATREGRIKNRRVYVIVSNGGQVAK